MHNENPSRKNDVLCRIKSGETLISDGATGTFLQQNGLEPGGDPEEFNATRPDVVKRMASEYFLSGSDLVLTNSFGGTVYRQSHYGFGDRVAEFNKLAAEHAKSQATKDKFVFGSVGPTGEFLQPLGNVSDGEMYDAFKIQVTALEAGGADGVVIETMTAMEEASLAIQAAKENTHLTVAATMTFHKGPRGYFTMMGITPEQAASGLAESGADIVGTNCGNGIDNMIEIAERMRSATALPLLVHSNAGIPGMEKGEIIYPESPEFMAERFLQLKEVGVNIIGGCCGTGPAHIEALAKALGKR